MTTTLIFASESVGSRDVVAKCLNELSQIKSGELVAVGRPGAFLDTTLNELGLLHELVAPAKLTPGTRRRLVASSDYVLGFWDGRTMTELVFESRVQRRPIKLVAVETAVVVNKDRGDPYDVYIGRGTMWGNPFVVGIGDGRHSREEAISLFKNYFESEILSDKSKVAALKSMRGLRLACHCKPLACHGDVIADYINRLPAEDVHRDNTEIEAVK
jgi:hypothetical protein